MAILLNNSLGDINKFLSQFEFDHVAKDEDEKCEWLCFYRKPQTFNHSSASHYHTSKLPPPTIFMSHSAKKLFKTLAINCFVISNGLVVKVSKTN